MRSTTVRHHVAYATPPAVSLQKKRRIFGCMTPILSGCPTVAMQNGATYAVPYHPVLPGNTVSVYCTDGSLAQVLTCTEQGVYDENSIATC